MMLRKVFKKLGAVLGVSVAVMALPASFSAYDQGGNADRRRLSLVERIERFNREGQDFNRDAGALAVNAGALDSVRYNTVIDYVRAMERYLRVDLSRVSSSEILNVPRVILMPEIVDRGIAGMANLNIESFDPGTQAMIRNAEDLHNRLEAHRAEEAAVRRETAREANSGRNW